MKRYNLSFHMCLSARERMRWRTEDEQTSKTPINEKQLSTWSLLFLCSFISFTISFYIYCSLYLFTSLVVSLFHSLCQTQQMEAQMINSLTDGEEERKGKERKVDGEELFWGMRTGKDTGQKQGWEGGEGSFRLGWGEGNWALCVEWFLTQSRF